MQQMRNCCQGARAILHGVWAAKKPDSGRLPTRKEQMQDVQKRQSRGSGSDMHDMRSMHSGRTGMGYGAGALHAFPEERNLRPPMNISSSQRSPYDGKDGANSQMLLGAGRNYWE